MTTMNASLPASLKAFDQDRQKLRGLLLEGAGSEHGEAADASYFAELRARVAGRAKG